MISNVKEIINHSKLATCEFFTFMEHLLPPPKAEDKFKGCELVFPDTIFFKKKIARKWIKHDKDFCLTSTTNPSKIGQQNILKEVQNTVRERNKDKNGEFKKRYQKEFQMAALEKLQNSTNPASPKDGKKKKF